MVAISVRVLVQLFLPTLDFLLETEFTQVATQPMLDLGLHLSKSVIHLFSLQVEAAVDQRH